MKKILLTTTLLILYTGLAAQPQMGGMGRGNGRPPGGGRGEGRPLIHNNNSQEGSFMIMGIPDIPELTLEQREKLSKAISDERKDISKLMQEKQELKRKADNPGIAEKERVKLSEKADKTDEKINEKQEKYDKKYKSILTAEQYQIFSEKKKDIEFRELHKRPAHRSDRRKGGEIPSERPENTTRRE